MQSNSTVTESKVDRKKLYNPLYDVMFINDENTLKVTNIMMHFYKEKHIYL